MLKYRVAFDGASKGNPGPAGWGVVAFRNDVKIATHFGSSGVATNNVAEYHGVINALQWALNNVKDVMAEVAITGDSALVINQVLGRWKVSAPNLAQLHQRAQVMFKQLQQRCPRATITHTMRELNTDADAASNRGVACSTENWLQSALLPLFTPVAATAAALGGAGAVASLLTEAAVEAFTSQSPRMPTTPRSSGRSVGSARPSFDPNDDGHVAYFYKVVDLLNMHTSALRNTSKACRGHTLTELTEALNQVQKCAPFSISIESDTAVSNVTRTLERAALKLLSANVASEQGKGLPTVIELDFLHQPT